jgi:pimeloyl-ACP methyl ester carboxylesterase
VRSHERDALPLILTHGWPGSVVEFLNAIGPLTDPVAHGGAAEDAFHVVCPSLPGYGFSDKPTGAGVGVDWIARAWAELMSRLSYERYGAQGGDWGGQVSLKLARADAEHLVGVHLNLATASPEALMAFGELTEEERDCLGAISHYFDHEAGYSMQQSTRPQTLGYSLVDSPVGPCAWIVEKFFAWTDCDGHPENAVSRDELLDNVTLYWLELEYRGALAETP